MFKIRKNLLLCLWSALFAAPLSAASVVTFPVPAHVQHNNDFTVRVRIPGGKWMELFEYQVQVDMHNVRNSTMVLFDFEGPVELAVTSNNVRVDSARIRPFSKGIPCRIKGRTVYFTLGQPVDVSVEINGDIFHNLQIFTNHPESTRPDSTDASVVYFGPGYHVVDSIVLKSNQKLYLAGGAVVKGVVVCDKVKNVQVSGRGIFLNGSRGVEIKHSSGVTIEDVVFVNPSHYTIFGGASDHLAVKGIRSFSSKGWADGIDLMSCSDVLVDKVFMRTSDDCIALYGHRWQFYGDCKNVVVSRSVLWADVAHPIMMGTHGNPDSEHAEVLENIVFKDIDILNHDEPQVDYQGCMTINVSDGNLARNILFEDIRVEEFERGQLFNLRVTFNKKYATAPGRAIEQVEFRNITYRGKQPGLSIAEGLSDERPVRNIIFRNLNINGKVIAEGMEKPGYMKVADFVPLYEGVGTSGIRFLP